MTDETKQLFDAPWTVTREEIRKDTVRYGVAKSHLDLVAIDLTHEDAHRLARLPELYEALADATSHYCSICRYEPIKFENLVKNGCPKTHYKNLAYPVSSVALDWLELLRKVRDGE